MIFDNYKTLPGGRRKRVGVSIVCNKPGCGAREDYPSSYTWPEVAAAARDKRGWSIVCVAEKPFPRFHHYCPECVILQQTGPDYLERLRA